VRDTLTISPLQRSRMLARVSTTLQIDFSGSGLWRWLTGR